MKNFIYLITLPKSGIKGTAKKFEKMMLTEKIEHFGNPVLRWMMAPTVVKTDPAGNIKPDKEKSVQKIDGFEKVAIFALEHILSVTARCFCSRYSAPNSEYLFLNLIAKVCGNQKSLYICDI